LPCDCRVPGRAGGLAQLGPELGVVVGWIVGAMAIGNRSIEDQLEPLPRIASVLELMADWVEHQPDDLLGGTYARRNNAL